MAVYPPEVPPSIEIPLPTPPDPTEPAVAVEAGVTTSEWKLVVAYITQLAITATGTIVAQAGFHVSQSVLQYAANFEVLGAILAVSYVASRTIRKKGATA
jgi:hypothetical protein